MGSKDIDDRFKKFGTVSFTATTKVNDFIDFLEQGKVMGTLCRGCGLKFFPPRADCSRYKYSFVPKFALLLVPSI